MTCTRRAAAVVMAVAAAVIPAGALAVSATPNDPYFGVQWGLHGSPASTNANQAWCASTGAGILVADIDTGVDFGHPDLGGHLVAGAAFTSGSSNPSSPTPDAVGQGAVMDDYGHGTMTTGLMVAGAGNGTGIAGAAPGARALVMKVFGQHTNSSTGQTTYDAYDSDVSSAVVWAAQHGARVVNLSLGPSVPVVSSALGDTIPQTVQWAAQNGVAVAIAAGNTYIPAADYLGMQKYALVVGALGPSGARASYSQSGTGVNIYAPGGDGPGGDPGSDIISTFPTYPLPAANQPLSENVAPGYAAYDGTSFATPYTAAVLALLMAHGDSSDQARQQILNTASTVGGRPAVDAPAALGACTAAQSGGAGGTRSGGGVAGAPAGQAGGGAARPGAAAASASAAPATGSPSPGTGQAAAPADPGVAGGPASAVPGGSGSSGGGPSPLVLGVLAALVILGAPLGAWLVRSLRRPPV
ncbi:MAG TPA: S8 family serine peptidase [Candidatus Dormibacteraeota bacterium]|nr:S8 family serine peptidase [Candidatus Dormibacteraeota bacterium]